MSVRVYLDVDGVINSMPMRGTSTDHLVENTGWTEWSSGRAMGYLITWSPQMIAELNKLADHEDVEFVWVTTWRGEARDKIAPLVGLNGRDWVYLTDGGEATGRLWGRPGAEWWKLTAVKDDLLHDPVDLVVWIDDELDARENAKEWAAERDVLLFAPDDRWGLSVSDIENIRKAILGSED